MRTGVCQSYQNHSKLICVNPQLTAVQRWTEDGDSTRKMLKASLSWAWIISFASSKQTSELVKDWTLRREEKRKKTQKLQPDKKRRKNTNSTSHKSSLNWVLETWFSTPRLMAQRVVSRVKDLTSGQEDDKLKFQRQRRYTFELKEIQTDLGTRNTPLNCTSYQHSESRITWSELLRESKKPKETSKHLTDWVKSRHTRQTTTLKLSTDQDFSKLSESITGVISRFNITSDCTHNIKLHDNWTKKGHSHSLLERQRANLRYSVVNSDAALKEILLRRVENSSSWVQQGFELTKLV